MVALLGLVRFLLRVGAVLLEHAAAEFGVDDLPHALSRHLHFDIGGFERRCPAPQHRLACRGIGEQLRRAGDPLGEGLAPLKPHRIADVLLAAFSALFRPDAMADEADEIDLLMG